MNQLWRHCIILILIVSLFASIPLLYALSGYRTISNLTEEMHTQDILMIKQVDQLIEHNRDRANAVRGLLLYEDDRYIEQYYFSTSKVHDLRRVLNSSNQTPGAVKDLLLRNNVWEEEIQEVFTVYETDHPQRAKKLAKQTTQTTQTILEDLSQIKEKLYRDLEQKLELTTEMTAEYKRMSFSLSILAFLLIATTIILFHRSKPLHENTTNTYRL
jgi:CHASE3 domain sensor protein